MRTQNCVSKRNLKTNFSKLFSLPLLLLVIACGAITVDMDTEVKDESEIIHDIRFEASGQIAIMLNRAYEKSEKATLSEQCAVEWDKGVFELLCTDIQRDALTEGTLEGFEGSAVLVEVTVTETEEYWEYRTTQKNGFFDADDLLKDNPLTEGMSLEAILDYHLDWNVKVPGEIVETNADSTEGGSAVFSAGLSDPREEFFVVSRKNKPFSLFGSCK